MRSIKSLDKDLYFISSENNVSLFKCLENDGVSIKYKKVCEFSDLSVQDNVEFNNEIMSYIKDDNYPTHNLLIYDCGAILYFIPKRKLYSTIKRVKKVSFDVFFNQIK